MSNAKDGCILSKDEWKSMFTILPENISIEFEPFCSGCANAKIEILNVNNKEIDITCSNIDGCRWAYESGKRRAFNEGGVKTNSYKCENCKHCEDEWLSLGFPHVKCDLTEYIIFPETLNDCENFEEKEVENGSDRIN